MTQEDVPQKRMNASLTTYVITRESRLDMTFQWVDGNDLPEPLLDLIHLLGLDRPEPVAPVIHATPENKAALLAFADRHVAVMPMFNKLKKILSSLNEGEVFYITDRLPESTREKLEFETWLELANSAEPGHVKQDFELFDSLLDYYDFEKYSNGSRRVLGETRPELKRCRFCQRNAREGATFKQKAHAIPEGFGNKALVLTEECDDCNGHFGRGIEKHLLTFLGPQRAFVSTRGKNGLLDVRLAGGRIVSNSIKNLTISAQALTKTEEGFIADIGTMRFVPIECYKALCKMALSVMPEKHLAALQGKRAAEAL